MDKKALVGKELIDGACYVDDAELAYNDVAGCDAEETGPKRLIIVINPGG